MKPLKQRIAIAEACGIVPVDEAKFPTEESFRTHRAHALEKLPDYLTDLNAMHEAEGGLTPQQKIEYSKRLCQRHMSISFQIWMPAVFATSAQRAEAFLRTIGKWED